MASKLRPVMPVDLFMAAIEGNNNLLIPRLELQHEEPTDQIQVTIEATHSSPQQINTELQSATGFGDTVLHLLVTYGHNVLALKVFQRDRSLLNAQNKISETPLHCAAKVGNWEFMRNLIELYSVIAEDAIKEIDKNGDTPFHVAAKHGHVHVIRKLMEWDPKIAHRVNNEMLCPLYIAIMKNYTRMVKEMLEVDPTLAYIPFSDGMFPVHLAACMGNIELVIHFIKQYPNCAKLLDPRGRNLFHIAAEKNQAKFFTNLFEDTNMGRMIKQMNNATDNEGNASLHIAAMKGHESIMKAIWKKRMCIDAEKIRNNEGLTPFELSTRQLKTNEYIAEEIEWHVAVKGPRFTQGWFDDVMNPESINNTWEITQVLELGSVLITTVTFAAAFTIPGGYNQNNGTPVLGKKYMFRAFILANTFAFMQGFANLLALLWRTGAKFGSRIRFATISFMLATSSMVVAFGLGMYVTLTPICYPIAVLILVITLITGSPVGILCSLLFGPKILRSIHSSLEPKRRWGYFDIVLFTILFLLIFCLALLA
ncbi:uncharacterized protein LOC144549436 [Carex rostrata]